MGHGFSISPGSWAGPPLGGFRGLWPGLQFVEAQAPLSRAQAGVFRPSRAGTALDLGISFFVSQVLHCSTCLLTVWIANTLSTVLGLSDQILAMNATYLLPTSDCCP